jgi:serine/threonine protein kinase
MAESHLEFTRPSHVVGRYALYGRLAAGGMATVHLGRLMEHDGSVRTVAVKRLHPQFCKDPEFVAMFIDEARLAARIKHPNVVETLDILTMGQELLLVMEYIRGECFSKLLRAARRKNLEPSIGVVGRIASGLLHGLHAAHEARDDNGEPLNVVHRDISPQNVMIDVQGGVKVLDFGVAKASARIQITRDGQMKGKLSYMSPEQLQGLPVDRRADVFACGVVLWEALTRRRLFVGEDASEVLRKILRDEVPAPSQWEPGLSPEIDRVVSRALCKDPERRYQTALELALDVERCIELAPESEVGAWIDSVAGEILGKRERLLEEIERSSLGDLPPGSDHSGASLVHGSITDSDTFQRIQSWAEREASKVVEEGRSVPPGEPDDDVEQTQTVADARCVDEVATVPPPDSGAGDVFTGSPFSGSPFSSAHVGRSSASHEQAPSVELDEPDSAVTLADDQGFGDLGHADRGRADLGYVTMPPVLPPGMPAALAADVRDFAASNVVELQPPAFAAAATGLAPAPRPRVRRIFAVIAAAAVLMGIASVAVISFQPAALLRATGTLMPSGDLPVASKGAEGADAPRSERGESVEAAQRDELPGVALALKTAEPGGDDLPIGSVAPTGSPATRAVVLNEDPERRTEGVAVSDLPLARETEETEEIGTKRPSGKERAQVSAPKKPRRAAPPRRPRSVPKAAPKPAATAATTPTTSKADCRQPYWVDDSGIRRLKLDCL